MKSRVRSMVSGMLVGLLLFSAAAMALHMSAESADAQSTGIRFCRNTCFTNPSNCNLGSFCCVGGLCIGAQW